MRTSRTALFQALRHTLGLARAAGRPGAPSVAELVERGRAARLTRREALRASAAATLALGGGPRRGDETGAAPASQRSAPRIAIVGAGIAGLNAAYELKKAGVRAEVYEAGPRLGGRIVSARDLAAPGIVTDLGGEFIDSGHADMLGLVREFHLELDDLEVPEDGLLPVTFFFEGAYRTEVQAIDAFRPLAKRIDRDLDKLGPPAGFRNDPEARALDRISVSEYLDAISARGWLRALIDVAFTAEFGLDCDHLSALNLLTFLSTDVSAGKFSIYGESDERYKVRGGSQRVIDELARRVEGPIHLGHRLVSVRNAGDALRLDFLGPNGGAVGVEADFAVLALPFSVLRHVDLRVELPPVKRRAIATLGYGTNSKLVLGVRRRVWRDRDCLGAIYSDEPFRTAWDSSRCQPGEAAGLTLFAGGQAGLAFGAGSPAEQAERLLPGVERTYPGVSAARNGRVERFHWPTAPFALGSYSCYRPGQWTTIAGAEAPPVGNLYFAGEHCNQPNSGFMNSGAASGRRTAKALLARLAAHE
jgi:monoamine oxidase